VTKEINGHKIEPGADLRGANLRGANLIGADLWYADLSGVNLTSADLWNADLRYADFTEAKGIDSAKGISKEFLRAAHKVGYLIYNEDN